MQLLPSGPSSASRLWDCLLSIAPMRSSSCRFSGFVRSLEIFDESAIASFSADRLVLTKTRACFPLFTASTARLSQFEGYLSILPSSQKSSPWLKTPFLSSTGRQSLTTSEASSHSASSSALPTVALRASIWALPSRWLSIISRVAPLS